MQDIAVQEFCIAEILAQQRPLQTMLITCYTGCEDGCSTDQTKDYIAELEEDIMPIDGLIGFAGSEAGAAVFGAEKAKEVEAHAKEIKAAGAKYCDCPACAACEVILSKLK